MVSPKTKNGVILSLVITIGVLGGLLWGNSYLTQKPTEPPLTGNTEKSSNAITNTVGQTIVFASLSGLQPQFIDQGPEKDTVGLNTKPMKFERR